MDLIAEVAARSLTLANIVFVAAGNSVGYVVGAVPGPGKVTAAAIAIPLTYFAKPVQRHRLSGRHCQGKQFRKRGFRYSHQYARRTAIGSDRDGRIPDG